MGRLRRVAISNVETEVGELQRFFRARNAGTLDLIARRAQTSRVEQANGHAPQVDYFFDRVAGRAMSLTDDDAFITEEAIEQTRFAGVGRAIDDDAHAFAQNASLLGCLQQRGHLCAHVLQPGAQLFAFIRRDVFVREINGSFGVRDETDELIADSANPFAKSAFQLFGGGAEGEIGFGANQIDDGFGLGQIHFAVKKGALGKFARARGPRTGPQTGFENARAHQHAAVTADFDQVFAGITGGRAMDREQHLVDHAPGSIASLRCDFAGGAHDPTVGGPRRHLFAATDPLYFSYWIRTGSLDTAISIAEWIDAASDMYIGPFSSELTVVYSVATGGVGQIMLTDSANIDPACVRLTDGTVVGCNGNFATYAFTEARAIAGCNTPPDGFDAIICDNTSGSYGNFSTVSTTSAQFDGGWHFVEGYMKMNSIDGSVGVADGRARYWVDGALIYSSDRMLYRTAARPTLVWGQLFLYPYANVPPTVPTTIWVDELTVARGL